MRRIASWLVAILTLFLIASLAWISFVGSPRLRERLASELSRATGYPIKMSGDLDLEFFPRPGVKVQGVEIASPNPGAGKPLVRVARLEIGIAVLESLSTRLLTFRTLELRGVEVWLSRDARGRGNWLVESTEKDSPPGEFLEAPIDPTPHNLEVDDLELHFHDEASQQTFGFSLSLASSERQERGGAVEFKLRGKLNGEAFDSSGSLSPRAGGNGSKSALWHADLQLDLGKEAARLTVEGVLGALPDTSELNLQFTLSSPEPAALAHRLGIGSTRAWAEVVGHARLKGRLRAGDKDRWMLQDGVLSLGRSGYLKLEASYSIQDLVRGEGLESELSMKSPDLARVLEPLDLGLGRLGPSSLNASLRGSIGAPRVEEISLIVQPKEDLELRVQGALRYEEGAVEAGLDLTLEADDIESLADFASRLDREETKKAQALLDDLKARPLVQRLLALKPVAFSARLESSGTHGSLSNLHAKAGVSQKDWIEASGRAKSIWPEQDEFDFQLRGRLVAPNSWPELADRPAGHVRKVELATRLTKKRKRPARLHEIDIRIQGVEDVDVSLRGSVVLAGDGDEQSHVLDVGIGAVNLDALAKIWGESMPDWGRVAFRGKLEGSLQKLRFRALDLGLGKTRIVGRGSFFRDADLPQIDLDLELKDLDLRDLDGLLRPEMGAAAKNSREIRSPEHEEDAADIPLSPERLEWLSRSKGRVKLRADRVILGEEWTARDLSAEVNWLDGVLHGPDIGMTWPDGDFRLKANLDTSHPQPRFSVHLESHGLDLASFATWAGIPGVATGRFRAMIDLSTGGSKAETLISGLGGSLWIDVGEGTLADRYADAVALSLASEPRTGSVPMTCFIAALRLEEGIVRSEALLWDTPKKQVRGMGVIDLPERKLDLLLRPHLKQTIATAITAAVRIKGPFDDLHIRPEPLKTATDLTRGLVGRALGVVKKVSPELSGVVVKIRSATDKALNSTGVDVPVVMDLLGDPVTCESTSAGAGLEALRSNGSASR